MREGLFRKMEQGIGSVTLQIRGSDHLGYPISAFGLFQRLSISGSLIGGLSETQEMLDFCGKHNITADVEVIPIHKVNEAY